MKSLVFLSFLVILALSFNLVHLTDDQACQDSYASLQTQIANLPQRLDVTPKVYSQKVFDVVRAVPNTLDACDLPEVHQQFDYYLPNVCINELQDLLTLYDQYDRATNNITKTLYLTQLTARLGVTFPLKCPHLYEIVKHFINNTQLLQSTEITAECGESVYQYSLLIEKVVQDIVRGNHKLAEDAVNAVIKFPDTLDKCGYKQLADEIRRDLPQECLDSFVSLGHTIEEFVFNHAHFEWIFLHRKELFRAVRQIHFTCPIF